MGATGYGAAQGLESVLSRLFQEAQAKQQAAEAQARLDLQRQSLAQDQSQFDANMGFNRDKFASDQTNNERTYNLQAGNLAMDGTKFAQDRMDAEAGRERQSAMDAANAAWKGTDLANSNNEAAKDRSLQRELAGMRQAGNGPASTPATSSYAAERNQRSIDAADALSQKVSNWTAGPGSMLGMVPGTDATDFGAELDTLKANIAFNELAQMREASKTGGALGAISERELALLESSLGALNPRQSPDNLKAQLAKVKESLVRWQQAQSASGLGVPMQTQGAPRQAPTSTGPVRWQRGPNGVPVKVQ